ncbi:hypothetical protein EJ05DRAFT_312068 [Pseudovirgaria hyperparasitica]|uniref:Geranylgeranyl pyrophosphate synthetase n=1 Tax=Pseudovirgaria hyperparasitica TaxID=470096 RepID=A0A6A6WD10_9PEZI|nr:uncharacterized protein EJ05DRAFT_312068 [Pseudovirgaria hyperparasitica]KAF2759850.1 hypothetical protein EJ05DRAFT_312068 [Pseudovirgaria hyperparasitica]
MRYESRPDRAYRPSTSFSRGSGASSRGIFNVSQNRWRRATEERPPSPPLGPLLETVTRDELISEISMGEYEVADAYITNVEYLASYNWTTQEEVLIIPGCPPAWTPIQEARKLAPDSGKYLRDRNAAQSPVHPLEPAVRALFEENEDFRGQDIDLFACSSTFGGLLRFVLGVDKSVRFFVQTLGNTAFFIRRENSPTELISNVKGYGHAFPEAYTTWSKDVRGSTSHQRLLRYRFAGLNVVLRFEADGYLPSKVEQAHMTTSAASEAPNELESSLNGFRIDSSDIEPSVGSRTWTIKHAGSRVPQSAIFDLKTRSVRSPFQNVFEEERPRFWAAQISNLILARHEQGVFNEIEIMETGEEVRKWERENQDSLRQLGSLIRMILAISASRTNEKLEVYRKDDGSLELREQLGDDHEVLSAGLKEKWLSDPQDTPPLPGTTLKQSGKSTFENMAPGSGQENTKTLGDGDLDGSSDEDSNADFTNCSEVCGYCGRC